jgi:hypothetical protein
MTLATPPAPIMFAAATAGQYIAIDVTGQVQNWVNAGGLSSGFYSFALASSNANILMDSKENDETGHAPTLDVTITSMGATGATGSQGIQGNIGPIGPQGS